MIKPVILCILDGWGVGKPSENNAIHLANTPNWDRLVETYGMAELRTDGEAVGLPEGQMGNSEVGHMTIGSGRILLQDLPRINKAFADGSIAQMPKLDNMSGTCHIIGCFSDGGVHAHIEHIKEMANILESKGKKVLVHAFLDGRDVAQKSALKYLDDAGLNIATVSGRYYAMDRDNRWDRVVLAYDAIISGEGQTSPDYNEAVNHAYQNEITDEFIVPTIIGDYAGVKDGDSFFCANFRADRAREICAAICDPEFNRFKRKKVAHFGYKLGMVEYSDLHNEYMETLFPSEIPANTMPEVVANAGLKQLRIAETEKYAHVTFFMSGGRELEFDGEKRDLIPSPNVATYDMQPEMSSAQVTANMVDAVKSGEYALIIANFANTDMVGHTGDLEAARKAVEAVDIAVGKLAEAVDSVGGVLLITADHGNAEEMQDHSGNPHTQHSLNPVPFIVASSKLGRVNIKNGGLADIAPTVLQLLGLDIPTEMSGINLIS